VNGYDYLIVGAGFAGSVVARELADRGRKCLVVDRRDHIAGNVYDEYDRVGVRIHRYGPHIFNANSDEIVAWLSRFTDWWPYEHRVLARTSKGLVPVPVNRTTIERFFGIELRSESACRKWLDQIIPFQATPPVNVEEKVVGEVGWQLYEELFKPYTEKQWGRHPRDLSPSVVGRLAARVSDDDRYFTSKFQAQPADGYTAMFERILDHPLIEVKTSTEGDEALGGHTYYGHLVWTGPVDEYFQHHYGPLPWRSLKFRLYHEHKPDHGFELPVGVVNTPGHDVETTRVTEYRQLTGQDHDWTTLHYEFPSDEGDPYYPVPSKEAHELYRRYEEATVALPGTTFVGRLATYKYLSMHQVIGQALRVARNLP
jgi:UDP-galactopyranose mutase